MKAANNSKHRSFVSSFIVILLFFTCFITFFEAAQSIPTEPLGETTVDDLGINIVYLPKSPYVGQSVTFNALFERPVIVNSYYWSFGDGSTSTDQVPTHIYSQDAIYDVVLNITYCISMSGYTLFGLASVTLEVQKAYVTPVADFNYDPNEPIEDQSIDFSDTSTCDVGAYIVRWFWDFGDQSISDKQNPTHSYTESGDYEVTLTIYDNKANSDTISKDITVSEYLVVDPDDDDTPPPVVDSDGDGVPDISDICQGHDDNVDSDNDGIPDGCDLTPNGDQPDDDDDDTVDNDDADAEDDDADNGGDAVDNDDADDEDDDADNGGDADDEDDDADDENNNEEDDPATYDEQAPTSNKPGSSFFIKSSAHDEEKQDIIDFSTIFILFLIFILISIVVLLLRQKNIHVDNEKTNNNQ